MDNQAIKLSKSWVETLDPKSGRKYYANIFTKEVSWNKPEDKIQKELDEERQKTKPKPGKEDVWLERQDPASGRVYYYNPARRETAWHRPDKTISSGALQADDGKGAWVERQDPRSGRTFYYNPVLGKTSWTNPDAEEEKSKTQAEAGAFKRLSMNIGNVAADATKRLSAGLKRISIVPGGGGAMDRHSARYSLSAPSMPVNKNEGRMSLRLGNKIEPGEGGDSIKAVISAANEDRFAKLRALKNQGFMPAGDIEAAPDLESFLKIDLEREAEGITWNVENKPFEGYALENFSNVKKGMFNTAQLDTNKLVCWQKKVITQPLHEIKDAALVYDAILGFKNILFYCGDKSTKKTPAFHAQIFLAIGNGTDEELQSELFAQLIKQSSSNPSLPSLERCWELIALASGTFKPAEKLIPYLKSHMKRASESSPSTAVKRFADYAMLRLTRIEPLSARLEVPCEAEIDASRRMVPFNIRINLVNSTAINMQVETWTTVGDINFALAKRLQIKNGTPFTCFEVNDEEMERVLEPTDRVLDIVSFWDREIARRKTKKYTPEFNFLYKMRLFFDLDEDDISAIELAYYQAVYDVNDSRYPCSEEDCINLAAFEAQEKFGDFNGSDIFGDDLGAYIPAKFYSEESRDHLKEKIYIVYSRLKGYDKLACKINYLDYVKGWKYYGSAYYFAEPITIKLMGKEFPKEVVIAINAKGVLIVDPGTLDLLAEYPYSEVVTWGHSTKNFVLVVGNLVRSQKVFFRTTEGLEMNSLIHAYVNKLMDAQ